MPDNWIGNIKLTSETEILDSDGTKIHDLISCDQGAGVPVDKVTHPVLWDKLPITDVAVLAGELTTLPQIMQSTGTSSLVQPGTNPASVTTNGFDVVSTIADEFGYLNYTLALGSNPKGGWTYMQGAVHVWRSTDGINWEVWRAIQPNTIHTKANESALFCWGYNRYDSAWVDRGIGYVPIVLGDGSSIPDNLIDSLDGAYGIAVAKTRRGNLMFTDDDWITSKDISNGNTFGNKMKLIPMGGYCILVDASQGRLHHISLDGVLTHTQSLAFADAARQGNNVVVLGFSGAEISIYDPITKVVITSDDRRAGHGSYLLSDSFTAYDGSVTVHTVHKWEEAKTIPDMTTPTGSPHPYKIVADKT